MFELKSQLKNKVSSVGKFMRLYPSNERAGRRVEAEGKQTAASGTSRQEIQLIRVKRIRAAGETAFCLSLFVENSRHVIRTDWFDRWFQ